MEIQWSLVLFTALSGAGAWLFVCVGIDAFKGQSRKAAFPSSLIAVVLLALGGLSSVTHLSHPERMVAAFGHPAPGIFLEALLLGLLAVTALVYAVLLRREASEIARKGLAIAGIVLAIVFSFACGSSYMMSSQATWNSITLPLGYMGTAAAAGTALWILLVSVLKEEAEVVRLAGWEGFAGGALSFVFAVTYGLVTGVVTGAEAPLFWIAVVACGGIAPAVCGYLVTRPSEKVFAYAVIALVGALVGSVAFRALMWLVGNALMTLFGVTI